VSPDGRLLAEINWGSGDLQLIDLETGTGRDLTGQGYDAGGYAWTSAFSTDGRRLAVSWYRDRADSHELRVVTLDGTGSRVLIPAGDEHYYVDPIDWSAADDEILVAVRTPDRTWQLVLVSAADGARRIIRQLGWQTPGGGHDQAYPDADLSPDGRLVAYDYPPDGGGHKRDIFAVPVDGGEATVLVAGPGSDRLLGWLPDGSGILYYSDVGGTPSVWRLRVRAGRPAGRPELVRAGVHGLIPLGFTSRGYAYGVASASGRVHTAIVDPATGAVRDPPRPVDEPVWRRSLAADWSPDGSRLAYVSHDPFPDPVESLVIVSEGGKRELVIPLTPAVHSSNGTLRWVSPDRILLFGYEQGREGIHAIDLRNGTSERLDTPPTIGRGALKWFEAGPGGRTLYFVGDSRSGARGNELLAFDVATGELRVLGTARAIPNSIAVSADGAELAFLARAEAGEVELRVLSTATGASRAIHRGRLSAPLAWSADGSRLIVEMADGGGSALWSIGTSGGEPVRILAGCCDENDVRVDRSGRRLAFVAGADRGEVRLLSDY
ncbi:MAG TPA: hypothetical protein VFO06_12640, partial [Gemmatimonadales bacterium]|nr:hypothetical protein [Gemmatimonadales bacterium]